jgi:hypothetical protein
VTERESEREGGREKEREKSGRLVSQKKREREEGGE